MSVQSLPQYNELSEENEMRTVGVEQGDKEELKAIFPPTICESEQQVSGYPVTHPIAQQPRQPAYRSAQTEQQEPLECGCGITWTIFFVGFILGGVIAWWIGVIVGAFVCQQDIRERPGFVANLIAAIVGTVILMIFIFSAY